MEMIFSALSSVLTVGLSMFPSVVEAHSHHTSIAGEPVEDSYFPHPPCFIETQRILDSNFQEKLDEIINPYHPSDEEACIAEDSPLSPDCNYDFRDLPENVIDAAEALCTSFDGAFYLETTISPFYATGHAGEETQIIVSSKPRCYGHCSSQEIKTYMGYLGSSFLDLSITRRKSRLGVGSKIDCAKNSEGILSEYSEKTAHLILDQNLDFFNKEKKCKKNSKGTHICNWDYDILSTDFLQKFEDTCHNIWGEGKFYIVDFSISHEDYTYIHTGTPLCFGTCSEDQVRYIIKSLWDSKNVSMEKEPNQRKSE